ncbi:MAG: sigma-70 family RNA polymerase sigma factor [Patescibacteria group bacterium]|jgi:RNA polymerase sigma factor (sigma-70 family)|nr:sigma-70 family RNA polymerase sigma factor [Patescibacteria group bacterium]
MALSPEKKLEKLYFEFKDMVFRIAMRFSRGNKEWAYDIVQETFLKLAQKLKDSDDIRDPKPFIYRTAMNLCINKINRKNNISRLMRKFFYKHTTIDSAYGNYEISPENTVYNNEVLDKLEKAISQLNHKRRIAVIMYYLEGVDIPSIAEYLGVNKGTVSRRLKQAREKLEKILGREWFEQHEQR